LFDFDVLQILAPYFLFFIGACFGSFANVVIYRWPQGESCIAPRSRCGACKNAILWYDNIPLVSWCIRRGRCRSCGTKFSSRYFFVELLMASLFCASYYFVGPSWYLLEVLIFIFGLVTASFIDLDHFLLPDFITLSGLVFGIVGAWLNPERSLADALLGAFLGGGFLWAIAYFYFLLRKQEGMGGGDIKLLAWIGAVLGWKAIAFVIISSSLIGSIVGLALALRSKDGMKTMIPFGPYLAFGAVLYLFGGQGLATWYLQLFIPALNSQ
jgi:leader peptidase (prepilin peptidase) / N-methyltransferase